jgi:mRNA interferase MazF
MVKKSYIPDRGDIVWLDFNPQSGHEQAGRRPALVVSPKSYNDKTGLALFCPVTSKIKGYPFEVRLPASGKVNGVVISDQVKSLDWASRNAEFASPANSDVIEEVLDKIKTLIA